MRWQVTRRRVVNPPDIGAGGFNRLQPPAADLLAVLPPPRRLVPWEEDAVVIPSNCNHLLRLPLGHDDVMHTAGNADLLAVLQPAQALRGQFLGAS